MAPADDAGAFRPANAIRDRRALMLLSIRVAGDRVALAQDIFDEIAIVEGRLPRSAADHRRLLLAYAGRDKATATSIARNLIMSGYQAIERPGLSPAVPDPADPPSYLNPATPGPAGPPSYLNPATPGPAGPPSYPNPATPGPAGPPS